MFDVAQMLTGYSLILGVCLIAWTYSFVKTNVNIVDSLWSLMFLTLALVYTLMSDTGSRSALILLLVSVWAIRLAVHLTHRNWNKPEDHRYATIRANNEPNFKFKSLYIVFGLQATLALIISTPLQLAINNTLAISLLDLVALALFIIGLTFEAAADYQLQRFSYNPDNRNKVLNTGVWRYSRHPNYFGECCIWWSFYLFALPVGGWWTVFSPVLMTLLLLKVSGVGLMESTIKSRRPGYADYVKQTSAFIPWFPKSRSSSHRNEEVIS